MMSFLNKTKVFIFISMLQAIISIVESIQCTYFKNPIVNGTGCSFLDGKYLYPPSPNPQIKCDARQAWPVNRKSFPKFDSVIECDNLISLVITGYSFQVS